VLASPPASSWSARPSRCRPSRASWTARAPCSPARSSPSAITIACGAVSGFHALISSGTTPKLLTRESDARLVGYGSMLMESFVGVMAMVAACALEPGVYFAINSPAGIVGATAEQAASTISGWGFPLDPAAMHQLADSVGEETLLNRTGARPRSRWAWPTSSAAPSGPPPARHLVPLRDHVRGAVHPDRPRRGDAGGRFMVQELLGRFGPGDRPHRLLTSTLLTSALIVGAWGYFSTRRSRPPGRDQLALAAVRHLEPDPGLGRPRGRHDDTDQDGEAALPVGDPRPHGVARHGDPHRELAEDLQREARASGSSPRRRRSSARSRKGGCRPRRWPTPAG